MKELIGGNMSELPNVYDAFTTPETPSAYTPPAEHIEITEPATPESSPNQLPEVLRRIDDTNKALGTFQDTLDEEALEIAEASIADLPISTDGLEISEVSLRAIKEARPDIDSHVIDALQQRVAEAKGLAAVANKLAPEQLDRDLSDLNAITNWRGVVDGYVAGDLQAEVGGVMIVCGTDYTELDYRTTTEASTSVHKVKDSFARHGYVLQSPDATAVVPEDWQPTPGADEAFHDWYSKSADIRKYLSPDRERDTEGLLPHDTVANAEYLIKHTQESPVVATDPTVRALAHAAEQKAEELQREHDEQVDATRCTETDRIKARGFDLLQEVGIADPETWVATRFIRHPGEFTQGIAAIEFVDGIAEPQVLADGRVAVMSGDYATGERVIKINVPLEKFAKINASEGHVGEATLKEQRQELYDKINSALDHELTHHVHNERMPIAVLCEWESVYSANDVATTAYGRMNREQQEHKDLIAREDLCDAVAQYLNKPLSFYDASPEQFAFVDKYYHDAWSDRGHEIIQSHIDRRNQQGAE